MKKSLISLLTVGVAAVFVALAGCEPQSDGGDISISPNGGRINAGSSVSLTASGGWDYKWSLSDSNVGRLSSSSGQNVVYFSYRDSTNASQTISVKAGNGVSNAVNMASVTFVQYGK